MKYLCIIYDQTDIADFPDHEALVAECAAYAEALRASGQMIAGEALEPITTATTVRVRQGRMTVTDGPFAETKEHLVGFVLIDARDLNDALQVAARIPSARSGSVEVRPIRTTMARR
ncbi:MAG TPA: YciI family protein [Candidatus Binatia bacterium]|jgi:hypothetical protein|nr:YciI family protein [Candidatus Binatia bacterium]